MKTKKCKSCGESFQPLPQVPNQTYCSAINCQHERKRQWHRSKIKVDRDYQANQASAQKAWGHRHPDYWRDYRRSHPQYAERNKKLQKKRSLKTVKQIIAKMDESNPLGSLPSGIYQLSLIDKTDTIAKMDVWTVKITVLNHKFESLTKIAKRGRVR